MADIEIAEDGLIIDVGGEERVGDLRRGDAALERAEFRLMSRISGTDLSRPRPS
jgi:hypothetical protein